MAVTTGQAQSLGAVGDFVSIRVDHTYQPITPIFGSWLGSITLSGSASMQIK